jgi:hypothetical protein
MDKNQDAKSFNAIGYPEDESLDKDEDISFGVARVNLSESEPKTAAQPKVKQTTGFQK